MRTKKILVVDDDMGMAKTLTDILAFKGYQAKQVNCGMQALELLGRDSYDWVISDIRMPDMNGIGLFKKVKSIQPGLKVILMTAYSSDEMLQTGREEGAIDVIDKPLDIDYLLMLLDH